jgi:polyamine oxidase
MINLTGIDTGKALLEEIRSESQNHLLEPFLALTLTQADAVSGLHKCDIPTQLYLSGKLSIPEAIL